MLRPEARFSAAEASYWFYGDWTPLHSEAPFNHGNPLTTDSRS